MQGGEYYESSVYRRKCTSVRPFQLRQKWDGLFFEQGQQPERFPPAQGFTVRYKQESEVAQLIADMTFDVVADSLPCTSAD